MRDLDKYAHPVAVKIATAVVEALLLDPDWSVTVNDGDEDTVVDSRDTDQILDAMGTTDHDYLRAYRLSDGKCMGWVMLIYCNAEDVISDYTVTLDRVLTPVFHRFEL